MNLQLVMARMPLVKLIAFAVLVIALITGCGKRQPPQTPQQRYDGAKALFEKASRDYHIPSAQARGQDRRQLEEQAAALYSDVVRNYSDQRGWASQALRSLANIRAAQTNITEAVKLYAEVAQRFPNQDFEV